MIIRSIFFSDIPALSKLAQSTYSATFGHTMSENELNEVLNNRSEKYFNSVFNKDIILIAEEDNKIIGFIQFGEVTYDKIKATESDMKLNKLYVDTSKQGKGIGKQLMEAMLKHKRLKNVKNIYLDVYTENVKAIGLYQKYGFKIVGKTPFKAGNKILGYDLLMKKTL